MKLKHFILGACFLLGLFVSGPLKAFQPKFGFSNPTISACTSNCTYTGTTTFTTVTTTNLIATNATTTNATSTNFATTNLIVSSLTDQQVYWSNNGLTAGSSNFTFNSSTNVLGVSSTVSTTHIQVGVGSATSPSIRSQDADSGIYNDATGQNFNFARNGSNVFAMNSAGLQLLNSTKFSPAITNNNDLGVSGVAFKNVYASGTNIVFSGLGAPGVTADLVCWKADGTLLHQATTCTVSSIWFKKNIESLSPSDLLAKVKALRAVQYDMKEGGKHEEGFIAEEVARIDPSLVVFEATTDKKRIAYINELYPGVVFLKDGKTYLPKTIDYARITVLLTGAVQFEDQRLTTLELKFDELDSKYRK